MCALSWRQVQEVMDRYGLRTSKRRTIKTVSQACRRTGEPAQRQTYLHASTDGLSRVLKILITGVVRQHKLSKRVTCDFSEVVVRVPQRVLGSNPRSPTRILSTSHVQQFGNVRQHKLSKRVTCDFSEVVVRVPQRVLGSNPRSPTRILSTSHVQQFGNDSRD